MRKRFSRLVLASVGLFTLSVAVASAGQTSSTTSETKTFHVIAVEGNQLVVRLPEGTREINVPDDFKFTVNGQPLSVRELKPGMSGTATITTKTTVTPVSVTEVKNGTVAQVSANSILVQTDQGYRMFSEADIKKRGIKMFKDGQPVSLTDFHTGDRLTATIVTEKPPRVMTERQVQATLAAGGAAAGSGGAAPARPEPKTGTPAAPAPRSAPAPRPAPLPSAPSTTAHPSPAPESTHKSLPKTASLLPLLGLVGAASGIAGAFLTSRRRRRAAS